MMRITTAAALAVVLVLGACAGEPEDAPTLSDPESNDEAGIDPDEENADDHAVEPVEPEEPGLDPDERLEPAPPEEGTDASGRLEDEIDTAIDDAAGRTGADPDAVSVVTAESVTWPDGSLGCPAPDQMYTMALVEGYRIVLEADGRELHYHGADDSPPFHCEEPTEPTHGGGRATR